MRNTSITESKKILEERIAVLGEVTKVSISELAEQADCIDATIDHVKSAEAINRQMVLDAFEVSSKAVISAVVLARSTMDAASEAYVITDKAITVMDKGIAVTNKSIASTDKAIAQIQQLKEQNFYLMGFINEIYNEFFCDCPVAGNA